MAEKYYSLEGTRKSKPMKTVQMVFGVICEVATVYYLISAIKSEGFNLTLLAAVTFLFLFGIYQILSGMGKTEKYFKINNGMISFRQHSVLPAVSLLASNIERIEIYPLSIKFFIKGRNKFIFRFGISYPEIIDPVKQEVIGFAGSKNIEIEIMDEEG